MKLEEFNKKYTYITDKERFNTSLDVCYMRGEFE